VGTVDLAGSIPCDQPQATTPSSNSAPEGGSRSLPPTRQYRVPLPPPSSKGAHLESPSHHPPPRFSPMAKVLLDVADGFLELGIDLGEDVRAAQKDLHARVKRTEVALSWWNAAAYGINKRGGRYRKKVPALPGGARGSGAVPPSRPAGAPILDTLRIWRKGEPSYKVTLPLATGGALTVALNGKEGLRESGEGRLFSTDGVRMPFREWRKAVATNIGRIALALPYGKMKRSALAKKRRFETCGDFSLIKSTTCCGLVKGTTITGECGLRTCPYCARLLADEERAKLVHAARGKLREKRKGYALRFLTFTLRFDPEDASEFTPWGLQARRSKLKEAVRHCWKAVLKQPGAGLRCREDMGAGGLLHVHALYYGPFVDVRELRSAFLERCPGSPQLDIQRVKDPMAGVVEVVKYIAKAPHWKRTLGDRLGSYIDPALAALIEISFARRHSAWGYGCFNNLGNNEPDPEPTTCEDCGGELGYEYQVVLTRTLPWSSITGVGRGPPIDTTAPG